MNKQELHDTIKNAENGVDIPVSDFISVYGNDRTQMKKSAEFPKGKATSNADILARVYGCTVTLDNNVYKFIRI